MRCMDIAEDTLQMQDRLATARAEEAEALRRAHHLRAVGSRGDYLAAMRDVDATHHDVARLQRELSWRKAD
jgi:hypothetical protein